MPGLLFSAYQKFYSAISCLERFDKEQNFFDNISCLDIFFAEYRNITFAIQAALKHTEYFSVYESNRDKYLTDHWFVDKRNETTKRQPFQLVKKIDITVYMPSDSISLYPLSFTVENDVSLISLKDDIKKFFVNLSCEEVFFSTAFSFFEDGTTTDLWDKLISGIHSMQEFMESMYKEVGEDCALCNQLRDKIQISKFLMVPKDFLLINDYVYYPRQDEFERAGRMAMLLSADGKMVASRRSLKKFVETEYFNYDGTPFGTFVRMHTVLRVISPGMDIMPAILTIYGDDTYDMDVFHADIKTTVYRKITEVAYRINEEDIRQVCFMSLYSYISDIENCPRISKERLTIASKDLLAFMSVDQELNEMEYVFDGDALSDVNYIACVMKNGRKDKLEIGRLNMSPVVQAFKEKKQEV